MSAYKCYITVEERDAVMVMPVGFLIYASVLRSPRVGTFITIGNGIVFLQSSLQDLFREETP